MVLSGIRKSWCMQNVHCLVRDNAANLMRGSEFENQKSIGCMPRPPVFCETYVIRAKYCRVVKTTPEKTS